MCWPEKWLPEDLGPNVRILSVSCSAARLSLGVYDDGEVGTLFSLFKDSLLMRYGKPVLCVPSEPFTFDSWNCLFQNDDKCTLRQAG